MRKLLFLLLLLPLQLLAQNSLTDSLAQELTIAKTDSERVELHYLLSKRFFLSDVKKGIEHAESAQKLSTSSGYQAGEAKALNLLGYAEVVLGEYDKALDFYFKALKIAEKSGASEAMIVSYNSIGTVYHRIKDNDRAIRYYNLSYDLAQKADDKLGMSKVYNNIGNIYEENKDYRTALKYFQKASKLQEELGHNGSWAISLFNIGNLHLYMEHPEEGLPYLFQSLRLNQEIGNKMIMAGTLKSVAAIYLALGRKDDALAYARQSYEMALETGSSKKVSESALLMQQVYAAHQDFEQAHKYLSTYVEHQNLLNLERQQKVLEELTIRFESEKKELENQMLKAENKLQAIEMEHQQILQIFGVALIVLMLGLVVLLDINRRRVKGKNQELQDINEHVQAKNREIEYQKSEIYSQATVLKLQNEELEQTSNFKNKLFSIISHDLRNPFHSIKGILGMIQRSGMSEKDMQRMFHLLNRDVEVTQNMLHNLLLWSKAQLEGPSVAFAPLNLYQLTAENFELVTSQAEDKGIRLSNKVANPTIILADEDRLNFVLRNLLTNAIKFSFAGGEVIIEAEETATEITLSISDQGKGISATNLTKLFSGSRFTTAGTASEKGTGLGLMFCKDFVKSMGGTLHVESEEGKGSTFSVTLQNSATTVGSRAATASEQENRDLKTA